ncbi:glutamyl-tRNA reductase [Helicobacter sp. 13S00477-4]|uniref:glutamyl-tRNA reductase n=1 Tax=Helicobacter sp. 13S00477-4 TaxID=1905759 RepID=UPI000BA59718|nr:glutamyl-tRNA reductase [Helicobacter sp. 13S00477-4]PAF50600.1 glutamyl-tRNA reductase [Helicobacter sp. 13S00477-4]
MEQLAGFLAISFSHKSTQIDIREKIAFSTTQEIKSFLQNLKIENKNIQEVVLLSTCNRVEIYIYTPEFEDTKKFVITKLSKKKSIDFEELQKNADIYTNQEAIHHVFCVASSLDSIVVGETQIAGQLKSAYKFCFDNQLCGKNLTRLIHFAFRCAAAVRNSTQISNNSISVASLAAKEANSLLEKNGIKDKIAVVIGVGEMGSLTSKHLLHYGYRILLLNRNKQKALVLAEELNSEYNDKIEVKNFSELPTLINQYPLLFCATSATQFIILDSMVEDVDFKRFWFDLSVPRNIQNPQIDKIHLFDVDDLQQVADENLESRKKNTIKAYEIVGQHTLDFSKWLQSLGIDPLIKKLRELAKNASLKELERSIKKGFLPKEYEENVAKILHSAFNVFLHQPTINLKKISDKEEADPIIEALKTIFDINDEVVLINRYKCEYDTILH